MPLDLVLPPIPLIPGDILTYSPSDLSGRLIALKTWHNVSHVETYIGDGKSIASRFPEGIGTYDIRLEHLRGIFRPQWNWDRENVLHWHNPRIGEPYDWVTLFTFLGFRERNPYDKGMICSEHAAWSALASGGRPFGNELCRKIAPFQFEITAHSIYLPQWMV
jgi:hypothetical protein